MTRSTSIQSAASGTASSRADRPLEVLSGRDERTRIEGSASCAERGNQPATEVIRRQGVVGALRPPRRAQRGLRFAVPLERGGKCDVEAAAFAREELAVDSLLDQGVAKGERAGRLVVDRHHVALDCLARVGLDRQGR